MYYNYTENDLPRMAHSEIYQWEHTQTGRQSYYNFARYLDVNHTALTQWTSGVAQPGGDDLAKLACKLGGEIYASAGRDAPFRAAAGPGMLL